MQAKEITVGQRIGIAAVAIGTLAVSLVGANELIDETEVPVSDVAIIAPQHAPRVSKSDRMPYLEMNTQGPAVSTEPVTSAADRADLDENTIPPTGTGAVVRSFEDIRFLR